MAGKREQVPKTLNSAVITSWAREKTKSANGEHLDYVLSLYEMLPDNPWVDLSPTEVELVHEMRLKTKGKLLSLLKKNPPPEGVTYQMISRILVGKQNRIRRNYLDYIKLLQKL